MSAPYWIKYAGSNGPWNNYGRVDGQASRVDGQANSYREKMAMFGIHDTSAVREQVPSAAEVKDNNDETAAEDGGEKEKKEDNGITAEKGDGEGKVEEAGVKHDK